jgi:hypothetical protein
MYLMMLGCTVEADQEKSTGRKPCFKYFSGGYQNFQDVQSLNIAFVRRHHVVSP